MSNMKRIVNLLLTIMMVCGMFSMVFARIEVPSTTTGDVGELGTTFNSVAGAILKLLTLIAGAIAVGMLIFIGIKYMTKGAGAKAEVKSTILPYLIGAILVASASGIASAVLSLGTDQ